MNKEIFGYLSLIFALMSYAPYMWSTWKGKTRPHVFTWVIWTLLMTIGTAGQYAGGAGPGAWSTTFTAISCFTIAILAVRQGDKNITRHDVIIRGAQRNSVMAYHQKSIYRNHSCNDCRPFRVPTNLTQSPP